MSSPPPHPGACDSPSPLPGSDPSVALANLLNTHGPRVRALALRLCSNASDADDVVQDTFLQAFRAWPRFRGESDPGTWLYTIASRACRKRFRRGQGARRSMPSFSQLLPFGEHQISAAAARDDRAESAADGAERAETIASVQRAIAALPEHFRVPLVLKDMLELSVEDVAFALGLKEDTVKTRLHRARLSLRGAMMRTASKVSAPAPIYEKQVCLDLLKAKLEAMNSGRGFRIPQAEVCARCRAVFRELDAVHDACADLAKGELPVQLRRRIEHAIRTRDAAESAQPAPRGRRPVRT